MEKSMHDDILLRVVKAALLLVLLGLSLYWTYYSYYQNLHILKSSTITSQPASGMAHVIHKSPPVNDSPPSLWELLPKFPALLSTLLSIFLGRIVYLLADDLMAWVKGKIKKKKP